MQSMAKGTANANRPAKLTILNTLKFIYTENGLKGLYRGVTPRIALGIWQTICMVSLADYVKIWYGWYCYPLYMQQLTGRTGSREDSRGMILYASFFIEL